MDSGNKIIRKEWTDDDIRYLVKNYTNMKVKEIAGHLNRTPLDIQLKAVRLRKQGVKIPDKRVMKSVKKTFVDELNKLIETEE